MNKHCLNTFLKRLGINAPEALEILGLVQKALAKLRIVVKSMFMYNGHGVFISPPPPLMVKNHAFALLILGPFPKGLFINDVMHKWGEGGLSKNDFL